MHDPGSKMKVPPSIWLEGESSKQASLHIKTEDVERDNNNVKDDHDDQQTPKDPVGMPDGDERCLNEPTEPPDEEEGERGRVDKSRVKLRVESIEMDKLRELS
ncbi:hypothetical protein BDN67DRAFT_1012773 [Paxillus ammoniavirescens]|nr:hypothetical protein BDN67DRAFT_1012773 [Paxillus ammoniavirescens]